MRKFISGGLLLVLFMVNSIPVSALNQGRIIANIPESSYTTTTNVEDEAVINVDYDMVEESILKQDELENPDVLLDEVSDVDIEQESNGSMSPMEESNNEIDSSQKEITVLEEEAEIEENPGQGEGEEEPSEGEEEPSEGEEEPLVDEDIIEEVINPHDVISYQTYLENGEWLESTSQGNPSGYPGEGLRVEGLTIESTMDIGLTYGVHVQNIGWQESKQAGELAGTLDQSKRIEALWVDVNDETKVQYDVLYRVYVEGRGWLNWASNGHKTGSVGFAKRIESISIILVSKEESIDYIIDNLLLEEKKIHYIGHVQNKGWQESSEETFMMGTIGESLRLEALDFSLEKDIKILHQAHVANLGWTDELSNNEICGTVGQSKAMEAVRLKLSGDNDERFDLFYRVHVQRIGWMDWTKNGSMAGTSGLALRIEAIEVRMIPKGMDLIQANEDGAYFVATKIKVNYEAYVQDKGWMEKKSDGETTGTTGESKRLEAFTVGLENNLRVNLSYSAFIKGSGWQNFTSEPNTMGFPGQGKNIEAINIKLQGGFVDLYHIYYRVHVSQMGWLDWSENGKPNGTSGYDYRVEAMEVIVLPKTIAFKGNVKNPYPVKLVEVKPVERKDTIAKKGTVYYTTKETSLYSSPSGAQWLATIPKAVFLFNKSNVTSWIYTEYNGVKGYVRGGDVSGHTVTLGGETIIVNKGNPLPASFAPGVNYHANQALNKMVNDASKKGVTLNMYSGYRSYSYQKDLYNRYVQKDGKKAADTYSMRPGYSEHQTGLTFDIGGKDSSLWTSSSFGNTKEGKWLKANAPYYGFILRYPKEKESITGIKYEPWHFRYVGVDLAHTITKSGKCLDEYFDVVAPNY